MLYVDVSTYICPKLSILSIYIPFMWVHHVSHKSPECRKRNLTWPVYLIGYPPEQFEYTTECCSTSRVAIAQGSASLFVACLLPVPTNVTSLIKYSVDHWRFGVHHYKWGYLDFGPQLLECRTAVSITPVTKLTNYHFWMTFIKHSRFRPNSPTQLINRYSKTYFLVSSK